MTTAVDWITLAALLVSVISTAVVIMTRKKPLYVVKTNIGSYWPAPDTIHFDKPQVTINVYNRGLGAIDIHHVSISIRWNRLQRFFARITRTTPPGSIDKFMYLPYGLQISEPPRRLESGSRLTWAVPLVLIKEHAPHLGKVSRFRARVELADGAVIWSKKMYPKGTISDGVKNA